MIFASSLFLVYFLPVFMFLYFAVPQRWRNYLLLAGSIFFYSWGAPRFIFVILGTTIIDFFLVRKMDNSENEWGRRALLTLSVCINVGLLFYFKYSNFFIENLNALLEIFGVKPIGWLKLALPIGISFYTFETITYVVDVYRRVHKPQPNFLNYQLYIIFFPKLIAGPIIRYHEFADQIDKRVFSDSYYNRLAGFVRFAIGLAKKVIIANPCGAIADQILSSDGGFISSSTAWVGIIAYTMQIYFDFSGYSDMAIGLGRMMGFRIPENFNSPYTAGSITEFWRRWHITLGNWMRNYLYIPLGGNKVSTKSRLYFNLIVVFLLSGFWHGASWNFIFWGAFHGFFLVIERAFLLKYYERVSHLIRVPVNFLIVMIGWVFFRLETFNEATTFIATMFSFTDGSRLSITTDQWSILAAGLLFSFLTMSTIGKNLENYFFEPSRPRLSYLITIGLTGALLFSVSLGMITSVGFNPFIYFRF